LLLSPTDLGPRHGPVRRRLAIINGKTRRRTAWFKMRKDWWRVDVGPPCDAVFTYMNDLGPRLCLVPPLVTCTNTLHCIRFKDHTSPIQRVAAALTFATTFGQLFAEISGRSYGGVKAGSTAYRGGGARPYQPAEA
jgi:adenine-specific DNA-methyltransferase